MKTKISAAVIALFFLMACGSSEQKQADQTATETSGQAKKFILKASNMKYVAIQPDSTLSANQSDPTKAEVFEKVDLENGKSSIKASNGRYVTDNRGDEAKMNVVYDHASEWETFEFIALDPTRINIKSSTGRFVSSDPGQDGKVTANRDNASDWETFTMEMK
jgi:hypothetical protein